MLRSPVRRHGGLIALALACMTTLLALTGCGGGADETPPSASALIDATGGALVGPDGVRLDVPAGALTGPVTLTITRDSSAAPALLDGQSPAVYAITPHGLQFQKPAVLTFPAALLPGQSAAQAKLLRAQPGGSWDVLDPPIAVADGDASVLLDGLSFYGHTSIGRSGPGRRTGVIQNSLGWVAPAPGVEVPGGGLNNPLRRIVERTTVRLVVASSVDPWCGGSATVTSTWLRWSTNAFTGYELLQKQTRQVAVANNSARATFEYDVPVGAATERFYFAGGSVCDNPAPLPPNPPQYGVLPHPWALALEAIAVAAPTITQQPVDMPAAPGDTVTFEVAATAPDTLTLAWQRSDDAGVTWAATGPNAGQLSFILLPAQAASLWRAKVCNVSAQGSNCRDSNTARVGAAPFAGAPWQRDSLIAGSGTHSMAVESSGEVLSWGRNNGGALGRSDSDPAPARVAGPAMRSVAAGGWYSVGLTRGGEVLAWGWGGNVGAAIGSTSVDNPLPRPVTGLTGVAGIATRYNHTLAVKSNGEVWGFGPEASRALGPLQGHARLRQIAGLAQMRQVAAGERHSLALAADGTVWSWGENGSGQLGDGAAALGTARATPQAIAGLTEVVEIAAGAGTSFALRRDGSVWSWGDAALVGRPGDPAAPAPVPGLADIKHLGAGHRTAWALTDAGAAFGWGDNRFGQVGVGVTHTLVSFPQPLSGGTQFLALAGGEFHGLALVFSAPGRSVRGFGGNGDLQINGVPGPNANAPVASGVALP